MIGFSDMKFVLLHEAKNDDGVKAFFYDVWEVYLKVCPGAPLHHATAACQTPHAVDCDEPISFGSYTHTKPYLRQSGEGQCEKVSVEAVYCMSTDGVKRITRVNFRICSDRLLCATLRRCSITAVI
jgi:hypothetical protein